MLREPSVVAMDKNTGKLLKVGTEANACWAVPRQHRRHASPAGGRHLRL